MSKRKETVTTEFGDAELLICECDGCGGTTVDGASWGVSIGWSRLIRPALDKNGKERADSRREEDFCSVDCLVRHLVPDIYSTDPHAVTAAVANLRKIEESLDHCA